MEYSNSLITTKEPSHPLPQTKGAARSEAETPLQVLTETDSAPPVPEAGSEGNSRQWVSQAEGCGDPHYIPRSQRPSGMHEARIDTRSAMQVRVAPAEARSVGGSQKNRHRHDARGADGCQEKKHVEG